MPADVCTFAITYMVTDVYLHQCTTAGNMNPFFSPPKHLSFFKNSFLSPVRWNIQKINSSLQIAQSSVPNPLQSLLVMIYSTRTKDISRTPEYIYWQVLWFYLQKILQTQSKGCSSFFYQRSLDFFFTKWPDPSHSHFGRWASSVILSISVVR